MSQIEVLDFFAEWCGPCHQMKPIIDELEKELHGKVTFTKIDVDEQPDVAEQYGVMSMPTFIIKKDGQVVESLVGTQSKDVLLSKLHA